MSQGKRYLAPYLVLSAGDMSQATLTSTVTEIPYLDNVVYQATWSGTPTGTFSVEVSLDGVNYVPLGLSPTPSASGSASSAIIELNQLGERFVRLVYTRIAGSGTLNAYIAAKGL
jgi:hypothetical protein